MDVRLTLSFLQARRAPPVRGQDRVHLSSRIEAWFVTNLLRPTPADPGHSRGGSSCPSAVCPSVPTSTSSSTRPRTCSARCTRGDPAALADLKEFHPEPIDPPAAKLADAQLVLARSYEASSWTRLVQAVQLVRRDLGATISKRCAIW